MDEASLSLLISHELAHYLLDHQVMRLRSVFVYEKITKRLNGVLRKKVEGQETAIEKEFKKRTQMVYWSDFYP